MEAIELQIMLDCKGEDSKHLLRDRSALPTSQISWSESDK
jgi:hypothetical protein